MFIVVRVNRRIRHNGKASARARTHTTNIRFAYYPNTLIAEASLKPKNTERTRSRCAKKKFTFGVVNKKSNKNFTRIVRTYFNMRYQNIYTISLTPTSPIPCLTHSPTLSVGRCLSPSAALLWLVIAIITFIIIVNFINPNGTLNLHIICTMQILSVFLAQYALCNCFP